MSGSNGFRVSLTDEDVAGIVIAAAQAADPNGWRFTRTSVMGTAVAAGRMLGQRVPLEPLDDGLRGVAAAAAEQLAGTGFTGILINLRRLDEWLQRYPARGIPDPEGSSDV